MAAVRNCGFELFPPTLSSINLAAFNYHLLHNIKKYLAGVQYRNDDDVISSGDNIFYQQDERFTNWIQALHHRRKKCVNRKGSMLKKKKTSFRHISWEYLERFRRASYLLVQSHWLYGRAV